MNHSEIIKEVTEKYLTTNGNINTAIIRRDWFLKSNIYKEVVLSTPKLPTNTAFAERFYWIKNGLTDYQKSKNCD